MLPRQSAPTDPFDARGLAVTAAQDGRDRGQTGRAVLLDLVADLPRGLAAGGVPPADMRAFQGQPAADRGAADQDCAAAARTGRLEPPARGDIRVEHQVAVHGQAVGQQGRPGVVAQPGTVEQQIAADPGFGEAEGTGLAFPLGAEVLVEPGPVPDRDEVGQQSLAPTR